MLRTSIVLGIGAALLFVLTACAGPGWGHGWGPGYGHGWTMNRGYAPGYGACGTFDRGRVSFR